MSKARIVVFGATGKQGMRIACYLLSAGKYHVAAVTRDASSLNAQRLAAYGADVVTADMLGQNSLSVVIRDSDIVILIIQPWSLLKGKYETDKEIIQAKNVIWASRQAGVRHLIYHSFIRAGSEPSGLSFIDSKLAIEQLITDSGLSFTILRFGPWLETLRADRTKKIISGNYSSGKATPYSSLNDAGPLAFNVASDPDKFSGKTLSVTVDVLTGASLAELASLSSGEKFLYVPANPFALRLKFPETYRLRKYLETHCREFQVMHKAYLSGQADILSEPTYASVFLENMLKIDDPGIPQAAGLSAVSSPEGCRCNP